MQVHFSAHHNPMPTMADLYRQFVNGLSPTGHSASRRVDCGYPLFPAAGAGNTFAQPLAFYPAIGVNGSRGQNSDTVDISGKK